ncbi:lipopolysaccharide biosynthesis protein [Liquorilactobacillus capillatus]|uniref:Transporter n=1 Tax=Liquorilactobacillus capillatus DSM 19910 TaxID=1423731 RepID=A0A0R1MBH5_9LACO|nr:oligosaccharide flippase family protein [Liquorilactobacillus capillatus]KRL02597.1 transporter [Liquorilactobacillus capillatus DSM 19910]
MRNSLVNSSVSVGAYSIRTLLGFVTRSIFINLLGVEILGLNGLFTNILSFFSLAELGIGTSIVYELYKPIVLNDKEEIKSLMRLYKNVYNAIGIIIGFLGILLVPMLPLFIKENSISGKVYIYYLLFLFNSVVSYFFTYKRSMLNADQKNYITVVNDLLFYCISVALQIILLVFFHSYTYYLIIQITTTIVSNISITFVVNRQYPFLKEKKVKKLSKDVIQNLKKNVVGNVSSQVGTIIVLGSDNIMLSAFVGLASVGLYSNYTLITNSVKSILQQATNAVIPSIGNLIADSTNGKSYRAFKMYWILNAAISYLAGVLVFAFINNFIFIWLGKKYVLPIHTSFFMSLYLVILMYQGTVRTFISAYGLFWQQRWKAMCEAFLNIVISTLLLVIFKLQIDGVLLGTIFSSACINLWFEPYIVFKYGFKSSAWWYIKNTIWFYFSFFITVIPIIMLNRWLIVTSMFNFLLNIIIIGLIIIIIFMAIFSARLDFRSIIIKLIIKQRRK